MGERNALEELCDYCDGCEENTKMGPWLIFQNDDGTYDDDLENVKTMQKWLNLKGPNTQHKLQVGEPVFIQKKAPCAEKAHIFDGETMAHGNLKGRRNKSDDTVWWVELTQKRKNGKLTRHDIPLP